jgi:two-component system sensor histidine kinase KdpD
VISPAIGEDMPVTRAVNNAALARDLLLALLAPVLALVAAQAIHSLFGVTRLGILFLGSVTLAASIRGSRAGVFAAFISVVAYRAFLDFRTDDQPTNVEDLLNLVIFLIVALITGALSGKVHDEAAKARRHAESMDLLFQTSRTLSEGDEEAFWAALTDALARGSGNGSMALDAGGLVRAQAGNVSDAAAAEVLGRQVLQSPSGKRTFRSGTWRARTIPADEPYAGVLLWEDCEPDSGMEEFVELVTDLGSACLSRSRVREERLRNQAAEEHGKLREALLSSISHDFRSPLAAIIGSATSLLEYGNLFGPDVRDDLLLNIRDEGEKLNQFVANLLNMTRLQAGVLKPNLQAVTVREPASAALDRVARHHGCQPKVSIDAECKVLADPMLLEQALYNILDNGLKYAPAEEGIQVTSVPMEGICEILITDHGPGLAKEDQAGIFNTFHFTRKNGQTKGTGLGLSISKGFVEAMGGTIEARDRRDRQAGLEIAITLPRSKE